MARMALALLSMVVDPWVVVCFLLARLLEGLPPLLLLWRVLCAALLVGPCLLGVVFLWVVGLVRVTALPFGFPLLSC